MEKLQYVVFTCFLTVAFSLSNKPIADSLLISPSPFSEGQTLGRRLGRELHTSSYKHVEKKNPEIVHGMKKPEIVNGSKDQVQNEGDEELIPIADYPGISTHHSPRPKHPKP